MKKKIPQRSPSNKRRKVEEKLVEKRSLKRKMVKLSDSDSNVENNVLNVVSTIRKKVCGKIITLNVVDDPLDNVSFHSEASVQKSKFVYHRKNSCERKLRKNVLEWKGEMNLLKDVGQIKPMSTI